MKAATWRLEALGDGLSTATASEGGARADPPGEEDEPPAREQPTEDYEAILVEHLGFIERTVAAVARRNALNASDADDLEGDVKLRLMVDDFAVLRKFKGKSRLTTYLTTVIHNIFRDFRIQRWGKWRPSAAAKRMGELGVQLDSLLHRDRFTFDEAVRILRDRFDRAVSDEVLCEMAARLPSRTGRRFEGDLVLARLPAAERADQTLMDAELLTTLERVERVLGKVLASLDPESQTMLRMRFADGLKLQAIADALNLEQRRRIYPRFQRLLADVRQQVEAEGVACEEVLDLIGWSGCEIEVGLT